ncbi:hypothetical protein [Actinoplanes regularis]|uniref:hypothetical protein n=1 Tax=Actinoplanes regularis TaxID=52697 RepID=UPI0024A2C0DF|nr:hypothetical protein [Actinoplanes regularis]GLW32272.1 hypothetical protein Areg01_52110 [Actinoplanes regularis]
MPAAVTTVPAVLLALVQLGQTALTGVTVFDGAPDTDNEPAEFLSIGFSRDEDDASVDGDTTDEGNHMSSETYAVHCILSVATGDSATGAVAERRARCAELFGALAAALRADPSLGGALTAGGRATLGPWSWVYGPSSQGGTYAEVEFDVNVSAGYLGMP